MVALCYRQCVSVHLRGRTYSIVHVPRLNVQRDDKDSFEQTERAGREEREASSAS